MNSEKDSLFVRTAAVAVIVLLTVLCMKLISKPDTTSAAASAETSAPAAETTSGSESPAAASDDAWITAYKDYLKEQAVSLAQDSQSEYAYDEYLGPLFCLIYLDGDDVPELVISEGAYHGASAILAAYSGGKVETFSDLGTSGSFTYKEKQSVIVDRSTNWSSSATTVYRLENGKLTDVWAGTEVMDDEDSSTFYVHDLEVSDAEYETQYSTYVPNDLQYIDRANSTTPPLTAKNIELYFDALADRSSIRTVRENTRLTLNGTVSAFAEDEVIGGYQSFDLAEPAVLQFSSDEFPSIVTTMTIPVFNAQNATPTGNREVTGYVSKDDSGSVRLVP